MAVCGSCGAENADRQRFCGSCAAPLAAPEERHRQRKTVTVVFCDVVGSTALGESSDPEAVEMLLGRYFRRMRAIVESHGGTVEKFIGDAVVAVFGVPVAHEDDALRALRAAAEMRDALPQVGIQGRIGVNTGEIVTSGYGTIVTGDAVNVAARLEQTAAPGEILVGAPTLALTRDAARVEELEPLRVKGKSERLAAFRLLEVGPGAERSHSGRFVGRREELAQLRDAWERTRKKGRCELITVVGEPGIGKSRLVEEFMLEARLRAARGHCVPYGEGITYFPVVEVIKQLGTLPEDGTASGVLRSLLGVHDAATTASEIAWAFRKLLEQAAPLLVVFDDIQWGEQTFLDLVEHVALRSREAPLLLLCVARPELLERRPEWPIALKLEPLSPDDVEALLPASFSDSFRERVSRAAGGNPLFLTEMMAVAAGPGDEVVVPPTLRALLAARVDQLESAERDVLQRGAVEGELFHRGGAEALSPVDAQVVSRLTALVRKELIRPDRPVFPDEVGFRFCHLLIRDAAYDALPKATRAELHERFADWLVRRAGELVERDEIVGYHLEQAHGYRLELPLPDVDAGEELGRRAAGHLASAGRRAFARGDTKVSANLLRRAADLLPEHSRERLELLPDLGEALTEIGEFDEAQRLLGAMTAATAIGDPILEADAILTRLLLARYTVADLDGWRRDAKRETERLIPLLQGEEAVAVRAKAWRLLSFVHGTVCLWEATAEALTHAIAAARLAGEGRLVARLSSAYVMALADGPTPAPKAIQRAEEILNDELIGREAEALIMLWVAPLHAMSCDFDQARELVSRATEILNELGTVLIGVMASQISARIELMAGDLEAAEALLRADYEALTAIEERYMRPIIAVWLAKTLFALGRLEEADELAAVTAEIASSDDVEAQAVLRSVRAGVLASRGQMTEARALATEALELSGQTDDVVFRADCLVAAAGALDDSAQERLVFLQEAFELYRQKEHVVGAERVEEELAGFAA